MSLESYLVLISSILFCTTWGAWRHPESEPGIDGWGLHLLHPQELLWQDH